MSNSLFNKTLEKRTDTNITNSHNDCYPADCQPEVCIPSCEDVDDREQDADTNKGLPPHLTK